jgi:predicted metal-dependent peptidase
MSNNTTANKKTTKKDEFVGKSVASVDAAARDKIIQSRVNLLINEPFFGNLATRLIIKNATEWLPTAATDGRHLYYNENFIMALRQDEVTFLVGHEILHVVYDHLGRRGTRDAQLYNVACDFAINLDLTEHKIGEKITTVGCLYDTKYRGWTSEKIYLDLYENAKKYDMNDLIDQLLDDHLDDDSDGDAGNGNQDGDKEGNGRPKRLSESERDEISKEMKQAIISAAQQSAGKLPAGVERLIQNVTEPIMPWRELIETTLTSAIKTDYTWSRPSRKSQHMDAMLPSMKPGEEIDITIAIDMSGSISTQQAQIFLGEIGGMMDTFDGFKVHVFCFDTKTYNPADFNSENMDTIDEYEPKGGGGTDFDCIYDYLKNNAIEPHRLIVFTDGYPCGSWGDEHYCDTTWVMHGTTSIVPPWGTWAYYDEYD